MWCKWCGLGEVVRYWLPGMLFYEECSSCKRRTPTMRLSFGNSANSQRFDDGEEA